MKTRKRAVCLIPRWPVIGKRRDDISIQRHAVFEVITQVNNPSHVGFSQPIPLLEDMTMSEYQVQLTFQEAPVQAEKGKTRAEVLWINQTCIDRLGYGPLFT